MRRVSGDKKEPLRQAISCLSQLSEMYVCKVVKEKNLRPLSDRNDDRG